MNIYRVTANSIVQLCKYNTQCYIVCTETHRAVTTGNRECGKRLGACSQYLVFQHHGRYYSIVAIDEPKQRKRVTTAKVLAALKIDETASDQIYSIVDKVIQQAQPHSAYSQLDKRRLIKVVPICDQRIQDDAQIGTDQFMYLYNNDCWHLITTNTLNAPALQLWMTSQPKVDLKIVPDTYRQFNKPALLYKGKLYFYCSAQSSSFEQVLDAQLHQLIPRYAVWRATSKATVQSITYPLLSEQLVRQALVPAKAKQIGVRISDHIQRAVSAATDQYYKKQLSANKSTKKLLSTHNSLRVFMGMPQADQQQVLSVRIGNSGNMLSVVKSDHGVYQYQAYIKLQQQLTYIQAIRAVAALLQKAADVLGNELPVFLDIVEHIVTSQVTKELVSNGPRQQ